MQITQKALFAIISHQELQKKITIGAALLLTRRHFCSQMRVNNLCTTECSNCAAAIMSALDGVEKADNPSGRYVAHLRHEFANIAERQVQPQNDTRRDSLGQPVKRESIFEDLLREIA